MKYAKLKDTGKIEVFRTLPRVHNGKQNYQSASEETHKADGFYPLIEPTFDSSVEKLSDIYFNSQEELFKYNIVPLTQEELKQKQLENLKQFLSKKRSDGLEYFNQKELEITQQLIGIGQEALYPILDEVDNIVYKALNLIKTGDYASCLRYMTQATSPQIPMVLNIWNTMKNDVVEYYTNQYPH